MQKTARHSAVVISASLSLVGYSLSSSSFDSLPSALSAAAPCALSPGVVVSALSLLAGSRRVESLTAADFSSMMVASSVKGSSLSSVSSLPLSPPYLRAAGQRAGSRATSISRRQKPRPPWCRLSSPYLTRSWLVNLRTSSESEA